MLRIVLTGLVIFVSFLLQTSVFPSALPIDICPNLFIILTASCGFMAEERVGLIVGFVCGLLYDVFFGEIIGFHALLYMYIGFINGKFARVFYPEDIKLPLALITVSDLTYSLICYITQFLVRGRLEFFFYLRNVILPEMVCTLVATLLFYPMILKWNEWLREIERRSEQKFV